MRFPSVTASYGLIAAGAAVAQELLKDFSERLAVSAHQLARPRFSLALSAV